MATAFPGPGQPLQRDYVAIAAGIDPLSRLKTTPLAEWLIDKAS